MTSTLSATYFFLFLMVNKIKMRFLFSLLSVEEKADNRKNESMERRKEEKLKLKAEKEARKVSQCIRGCVL